MQKLLIALCALLLSPAVFAAEKLVVHEWGTFTSLQDETGRAIGYLNSSAEPLPTFVHRLYSKLIVGDQPQDRFDKGLGLSGMAHPDVTMRLETPVLYFHPASKNAEPFAVDVTATFHGGVLSEFYPNAKPQITGGYPKADGIDRISAGTEGSLTWKLWVGGNLKLPETKDHVWLAPREVDSARITTGSENEQYVFYRGVGHIDAPLTAKMHDAKVELRGSADVMSQVWIANFESDGSCHATRVGSATQEIPNASAKMNLSALRADMKTALVSAGLFDDEAEAMLNTWEQSYFKTPGLRVFYLVPQNWTDQHLPLKLSVDADVKRVMIGRLELVTPQQSEAVKQLANAKLPADQRAKLFATLGRFGYALVLDELRQRPSETLAKFAKDQGIRSVAPPATQPVALNGAW